MTGFFHGQCNAVSVGWSHAPSIVRSLLQRLQLPSVWVDPQSIHTGPDPFCAASIPYPQRVHDVYWLRLLSHYSIAPRKVSPGWQFAGKIPPRSAAARAGRIFASKLSAGKTFLRGDAIFGRLLWGWRYILTSAKEVMFLPVSVCLFVCLCVSKITRKVMDGSFWNFEGMSGMA